MDGVGHWPNWEKQKESKKIEKDKFRSKLAGGTKSRSTAAKGKKKRCR